MQLVNQAANASVWRRRPSVQLTWAEKSSITHTRPLSANTISQLVIPYFSKRNDLGSCCFGFVPGGALVCENMWRHGAEILFDEWRHYLYLFIWALLHLNGFNYVHRPQLLQRYQNKRCYTIAIMNVIGSCVSSNIPDRSFYS